MPTTQSPPASPSPSTPLASVETKPGAAAVYEGLKNQRSVLRDELRELGNRRESLVEQIQSNGANLTGSALTGIESRIATIDKSLAAVDAQLAITDAQLAQAAAVPGAIVPEPVVPETGPPEEFYVLGGIFLIVVGLPLSVAYARRIWKRSTAVVMSIPAELVSRIQRIEQTVETSAVEIERIGEGQRFITKILGEQKLPALQARNEPPSES